MGFDVYVLDVLTRVDSPEPFRTDRDLGRIKAFTEGITRDRMSKNSLVGRLPEKMACVWVYVYVIELGRWVSATACTELGVIPVRGGRSSAELN